MLIYLSDVLIVSPEEITKAKWCEGALTVWLRGEELPFLYDDENRRTWERIASACFKN